MDTAARNRRPRVLLGITGSIAAVKGPRLALMLSESVKAHVKVVLTRTVEHYFWKNGGVIENYDTTVWAEFWAVVDSSRDRNLMKDDESEDWRLSNGYIDVHYAEEEWKDYRNLSSSVLHIQLRAWADILLIAPLSAHTLSKIANGLCDDLLSCTARAWDFGQRDGSKGKPVILCPAMNTAMWDHVLTRRQLNIFIEFGRIAKNLSGADQNGNNYSIVTIVEPVVKKLACGDIGAGALADLDDIIDRVKNCLYLNDYIRIQTLSDSHMRSNEEQTLATRKADVKNALLRYSKQKFSEMQLKQQSTSASTLIAPISPTPHDIIALFIPSLNLCADSFLIDLGCGDGRWLITAATLTECKCLGIDIDDQRLCLAKQSIEKEGLSHRIEIRNQDVFEFIEKDCEYVLNADVFVIYLFRDAMLKIGSFLQKRSNELRQGVKILCVGFPLPHWSAIQTKRSNGLTVYMYEK